MVRRSRDCIKDLKAAMVRNNSLVCCGLDPDIKRMPEEITKLRKGSEEKAYTFLQSVVDNTYRDICAYKIQKAFFDTFREGHTLLSDTISYIHRSQPQIPVIIDCKIGDTDNTMKVYAENIFGRLKADGVIVNPYMGEDVIEPFNDLKGKAVVVLVRTSNTSSDTIQTMSMYDKRPLWEHVLDLVVNKWNTSENLIPVLSSTSGDNMSNLRKLIPNSMPILLAGVGVQGGNINTIKPLLDSSGSGVFVNSSRGLLYPYKKTEKNWRKAIENATSEFKELINLQRR